MRLSPGHCLSLHVSGCDCQNFCGSSTFLFLSWGCISKEVDLHRWGAAHPILTDVTNTFLTYTSFDDRISKLNSNKHGDDTQDAQDIVITPANSASNCL